MYTPGTDQLMPSRTSTYRTTSAPRIWPHQTSMQHCWDNSQTTSWWRMRQGGGVWSPSLIQDLSATPGQTSSARRRCQPSPSRNSRHNSSITSPTTPSSRDSSTRTRACPLCPVPASTCRLTSSRTTSVSSTTWAGASSPRGAVQQRWARL